MPGRRQEGRNRPCASIHPGIHFLLFCPVYLLLRPFGLRSAAAVSLIQLPKYKKDRAGKRQKPPKIALSESN